MRYWSATTGTPIKYITCGKLLSVDGFLHRKRKLDFTVFILVNEGTLYMVQDGRRYEINKNQFIVLFENSAHDGWKKSLGKLSYYWVHFYMPKGINHIFYNLESIRDMLSNSNLNQEQNSALYILPETGTIHRDRKLPLLFGQLLDYGIENGENIQSIQQYSLSLLLMELSREIAGGFMAPPCKPFIINIKQWIRGNYQNQISVKSLARIFQYNPDYLSVEFRRQTGITLIQYINKTRIDIAKNLLTSNNLAIKDAAYSTGFEDTKYFLRVFKKLEGVTPTEYKKIFSGRQITSFGAEKYAPAAQR